MKKVMKKTLKNTFNKLRHSDYISPLVFSRLTLFYKRKYFENDYFYTTLKAKKVLGKKTGYQRFVLVGDNWLEKERNKEIAVVFGSEEWQYGFISDYLNEYRVAFIPKRMVSMQVVYALLTLKTEPSVLINWEYNSFNLLKFYARQTGLPVLRLSSAFVHSFVTDAKVTPYSLVLNKTDPKTFFTDFEKIETVLNDYDFSSNKTLMSEAKHAIALLVDLNITKDNFNVLIEQKDEKIALKKTVLVLEQSEGSIELQLQNPKKITRKRVREIVEEENPDAKIIYALDKIPITLSSVDHVYTISSPFALDALVRGIQVTLLGTPIYGGWGLTDDRVEFENRRRTLDILEIFSGIYLLYPRYLANINNPYLGFQSACLRLRAERAVYQHDLYTSKSIEDIAKSPFWPKIFFLNGRRKMAQRQELSIVKTIDFDSSLNNEPGKIFQIALLYGVYGVLQHHNAKKIFITKVRKYIDHDILNIFLVDIYKINPEKYILNHFIWYLSESDQSEYISQLPLEYENRKDEENEVTHNKGFNDKAVLFDLLEDHKKNRKFSEALMVAKELMLQGDTTTILLVRLAELAELTFDTHSARDIANLLQKTNLHAHNRAGIHLDIENFSFDESRESRKYLMVNYAKQLKLNPDRINRSWAIFKTYFNERDYDVFKGVLNLDNSQMFQKALAYLEIDEPDRACSVIENLIEQGDSSDKIYVVYAKILFATQRYSEAMKIIKRAIAIRATHENYTEVLRQLKSLAKFDEALELVKDAQKKKIKLTQEGHIMPIHFGLGNIEEGFRCFLDYSLKDKLIKYFGRSKYLDVTTMQSLKGLKNLLIIFSSGPAEEMRFASVYEEILDELGAKNFQMTCDYRLESLLTRSFASIKFIPVKRTRFFTSEYKRDEYNKLPGSDLCIALDNSGLKAVEASDQIVLLTDLLYRYRKNYSSFPGTAYLKADNSKKREYQKRLGSNRRYIGLSWRSSLTNSMRNVHYLKIEQLEPLFQIPDVVYVNFQYDDCSAELEWVEQRYPGKLINFEEIDQFNDFDSVAALMACMEVIISPVTAVIDLAGSIGCKGLLFGYHGELRWRHVDEEKHDVWFGHMRHITATFGDDEELVNNIVSAIEQQKY